jgi:hypothetical protein
VKQFISCAILSCLFAVLLACGVSKDLNGGVGSAKAPNVDPKENKKSDPSFYNLKSEELKLTYLAQPWQWNSFQILQDAQRYPKLQKKFIFPIQFSGWVTLDQVQPHFQKCAGTETLQPHFILRDDQGTQLEMVPGERYPVILEKLYMVKVVVENTAQCQSLDLQFGLLYGSKE